MPKAMRTKAAPRGWPKTPAKLSPGEEAFALHCRAEFHPLNQPVREHFFHPTRKWRFDFAFPAAKLAVEIEGGIFSGGRHTRGSAFISDCAKYNAAVLLGWRVLRYFTDQVTDGTAINDVKRALTS